MATTENAGSGRARRSWLLPTIAFSAGTFISAGIALVLNLTRTNLPPMAMVEEVKLTEPATLAAADPLAPLDSASAAVTFDRDNYPPMRGNVLEIAGEPRAVAVNFTTSSKPVSTPSVPETAGSAPANAADFANDPNIRWFNARPVRPAKTMWMEVTGYSPDEKSCGDSADGLTATMHSVSTNAMRMVAADTTVLPYGSMVSIPGYDTGSIVPVLDCGGAIKGAKLDLLFATDAEAMKWGRQRVLITVWEYADGKPAEDPRKVR